jgi:hypothetical protein
LWLFVTGSSAIAYAKYRPRQPWQQRPQIARRNPAGGPIIETAARERARRFGRWRNSLYELEEIADNTSTGFCDFRTMTTN